MERTEETGSQPPAIAVAMDLNTPEPSPPETQTDTAPAGAKSDPEPDDSSAPITDTASAGDKGAETQEGHDEDVDDVSACATATTSKKRKFPELFDGSQARKRKRSPLTPAQPKNAVVTLNELKPGLDYKLVEHRGPVHNPVFVIQVHVNGHTFTGEGRSKKAAKHEAAGAALKSFVQFKDTCEAQLAIRPKKYLLVDFTSDQSLDDENNGLGAGLVTTFDGAKAAPAAANAAATGTVALGEGASAVPASAEAEAVAVNETGGTGEAAGISAATAAPATTAVTAAQLASKAQAALVTNPGPPPAKKSKTSLADKNPVMLLNEMRPGLTYRVKESGDSPATKRFIMSVDVDGETLEGSGASKKLAKQACARTTLTKLYNMTFTPLGIAAGLPGDAAATAAAAAGAPEDLVPGTSVPVSEFSLPQSVSDRIGSLVMERFSLLMEGHAQHSRRKVLAGVVMTRDKAMLDMTIVSVSTGTKCVNGEHMSVSGQSLNDCHAEIISRRCLCEFLYRQLELLVTSKNGANNGNGQAAAAASAAPGEEAAAAAKTAEESIFQPRPNGKGYRLKENIRFHLYINTAPCGDARIFSPHEASVGVAGGVAATNLVESAVDRHPNRKARGQLRTKIESGEGTIPVKSSDGIQTWDGVLQGARLLTMSCSDKLARWNVVGVQGALLSHFVEPIYLYSLSLGSLFHPHHLFRAVAGRIQNTVAGLPPPYRLNVPRLNLLSSPEVRQPGKAPNYSVNWTAGGGGQDTDKAAGAGAGPEIIDAMKGKEQERGSASRLAKTSFFSRWLQLVETGQLQPISGNLYQTTNPGRVRAELRQYGQAKAAATDFQAAKEQLFMAFRKAELGSWVKKPMEQDEFHLDDY